MIALAVSDFELPRRLVIAGALKVDYLETGGHFAEPTAAALPQQPLLLHNGVFNWSLADMAALEHGDVVERTLRALAATRAPWLSVHLGFSAVEVMFDVWMRAKSPPLPRDELFRTICRNVNALAEAIPVPLILENLDYCPGGAYEHICDTTFISDVLEATNTGLLLDLAHAQVSASRMDIPIADYLHGLPLDRVCQIHVSGPRERGGTLVDVHEPLRAEDYALLEDVLARTHPQALTLEYHRDEAALHEQLARLREMMI